MRTREPEPLEQIDYGINHGAHGSSSNSINLKVDGGTIAIAFAVLAFGGVLVASILLPQLMDKQAEAAALRISQPIATQAAAARDMGYIAEREAKLNTEQLKVLQIELARKGIFVRLDGH